MSSDDFLDELPSEEKSELALIINQAYDQILESANTVLSRCRKTSNIQILREENPTLSEILAEMIIICDLMRDFDHLGYITFKADEYVQHVQRIVDAVNKGDGNELSIQVHTLNQRSFL